jgi:hypothetical protein
LLCTQAQDDILDVGHQQVSGVAVHILWSIGGAIATQIHSDNMETGLELPQLVAPGEPAQWVGVWGEVESEPPGCASNLRPAETFGYPTFLLWTSQKRGRGNTGQGADVPGRRGGRRGKGIQGRLYLNTHILSLQIPVSWFSLPAHFAHYLGPICSAPSGLLSPVSISWTAPGSQTYQFSGKPCRNSMRGPLPRPAETLCRRRPELCRRVEFM